MSDLQRNLMKAKLPPMVPRAAKNHPGRQKDYNPTIFNEYFFEFVDIQIDEGPSTFRVYKSKPIDDPYAPVLVMLHGGGFSALSWAVFTTEITQIINCQVLAIDLRGHGDTRTNDDDDLSADTMSRDIGDVLNKMFPSNVNQPNILLIGHSMGGAIAVHTASLRIIPTLVGIVVIDVVEGTAMESLQSMQSFLRSRPNNFKSIPTAIEWCVRSGQIRNIESAKVSMPGQIMNCETGKLATSELPLLVKEEPTGIVNPFAIPEEGEAPREFTVPAAGSAVKKYTWRIDLSRSERFWTGWFDGLSDKFLDIQIPKLLILAGIDNLDKKLTVGQMQGKFQLQVLARTGHAVHEDQPNQVAETIGSYLIRNKFASAAGDFVRQMPEC